MIYVIIGSEDGYLATFSSKKKAIEYATNYVLGGEEGDVEINEYDHGIYLYGNDRVTADIHKDKISK